MNLVEFLFYMPKKVWAPYFSTEFFGQKQPYGTVDWRLEYDSQLGEETKRLTLNKIMKSILRAPLSWTVQSRGLRSSKWHSFLPHYTHFHFLDELRQQCWHHLQLQLSPSALYWCKGLGNVCIGGGDSDSKIGLSENKVLTWDMKMQTLWSLIGSVTGFRAQNTNSKHIWDWETTLLYGRF